MFGRFIILAFFLANCSFGFSQDDSTFYKSAYAGSYLVVTDNETWELDRAFVNDGSAYSIQVSNTNFEQTTLYFGDTLRVPYYIAEMELLDNRDMVQYQFYFKLVEE